MTLFKHQPFYVILLVYVTVLAAALLGGGQAHAQSTQDMELLTQQERLAYTQRLQRATSSADRARITAEMNRNIQQRRMELLQHQEPQGKAKSQGQGKTK